ncbi:MAG: hypothetical protein KDI01_10570, partial [Halioglobus sp.]|nr:hypothetical protein [Halioglobus sp.]
TLTSTADQGVVAALTAITPTDELTMAPLYPVATVEQNIETVLSNLAASNPGLAVDIPGAVLEPENIRMWIDRAKSLMDSVGVCSINDLGRFRIEGLPILRAGAYVAPEAGSLLPGLWQALSEYKFAGVVGDGVLHFIPNQILHETAIVLAGEWDIRGQDVIIADEVRELKVVVESIAYDSASRISWQMPTLPPAPHYAPSPAPSGGKLHAPGMDGSNGVDGDQDPAHYKNGGTHAIATAPIITLWILDATNGLPPVDLGGQDGGTGGRGQDGGRGGDGREGLRADGTFFGGCCRGVGHGGDGGRGGRGGKGGTGGSGGQGGAVTLLTTPESIAALASGSLTLDVTPGNGGDGGPPGSPGSGGNGGPAGTAECEPWCDEHPERRGDNGSTGPVGSVGDPGGSGPPLASDAVQVLPITAEQWEHEFNQPHILALSPTEAEPGEKVIVNIKNGNPGGDALFFDGEQVPFNSPGSAWTFNVPLDSDGGFHPVLVKSLTDPDRRSNIAQLKVLPKLEEDDFPGDQRWEEGDIIELPARALMPGVQILAQDQSTVTPTSMVLPLAEPATRTLARVQIPNSNLGNLRGVRRIVARNPDAGESRAELVARIGQEIVVRCKAFRVVGTTPGIGTLRSTAEVTALFQEGAFIDSVNQPAAWGQANVVLQLVDAVQTITLADDLANIWPDDDDSMDEVALFNNNATDTGAMNFFFFRDVEGSTAFAWGGGPLFIADEPSGELGLVDFIQVVAHEIGHALCLPHSCYKEGEGVPDPVHFPVSCGPSHEQFLMYPFWDASDSLTLLQNEQTTARRTATWFETGKTTPAGTGRMFRSPGGSSTLCSSADGED